MGFPIFFHFLMNSLAFGLIIVIFIQSFPRFVLKVIVKNSPLITAFYFLPWLSAVKKRTVNSITRISSNRRETIEKMQSQNFASSTPMRESVSSSHSSSDMPLKKLSESSATATPKSVQLEPITANKQLLGKFHQSSILKKSQFKFSLPFNQQFFFLFYEKFSSLFSMFCP
jgi:hypothetical protein